MEEIVNYKIYIEINEKITENEKRSAVNLNHISSMKSNGNKKK